MASRESEAFGNGRKITVTMLGKSGCGKTVFLSSLYHQLAEGSFGFTASANNDRTDRELGEKIANFYLENEAPEGTQENSCTYEFSLMFDGEIVAEIDCFDFRGGAIADDAEGSESGKILQQRIASSDIVMWLVDLSEAKTVVGDIFSRRARLLTNLRRLQSICSQAMKTSPRLRVWSFVRTKTDIDYPELNEENLSTATEELFQHLGDVVAIATFSKESYANLVSIAPIGTATTVDGRVVPGGEAINIEWPLLTSIGMLMQQRLTFLDEQVEEAQGGDDIEAPWSIFNRKKETVTQELSADIIAAENEREFLSAILEKIEKNIPKSVMKLEGNHASEQPNV